MPMAGSSTGDIGHLDEDGFLYITDRKKELLKTSGGKLVAPQPIENKLKNSILVGQVALVGDKHKFISALISPNFCRAGRVGAHIARSRRPTRADLVDGQARGRRSTASWCAKPTPASPTSKPSSAFAWWPTNGRRIPAN